MIISGIGGMMDFPAGIIKSVQQFSIVLDSGQTSDTATITDVVTANSYIHWGGEVCAVTTAGANRAFADVTLTNTTTVTATRGSSTEAVTVYGTVVEFKVGIIQSIQQGQITIGSGSTSNTATINSVTTNNAFVHFNGQDGTSAAGTPEYICGHFVLTNATTVTFTRASSTTSTPAGRFVVVEFVSGILNSNAQPFSISLTGASNTATITSVTTGASMVIWGGHTDSATTAIYGTGWPRATLTDATTVTATRNAVSNTTVLKGTVIEFKPAYIKSINRGNIALTGVNTNTATITAVNTSKSIASYLGYSTTDATEVFQENYNSIVLTNTTTVTASNNTATTTLTASYEIVEFN